MSPSPMEDGPVQPRVFSAANDWPPCTKSPLERTACPPEDSHRYSFKNTAYRTVRHEEPDASSASGLPISFSPDFPHVPTPPLLSVESTSDSTDTSDDLYGPDRLFGPLLAVSGSSPSHIFTPTRNGTGGAVPGITAGCNDVVPSNMTAVANFVQHLKDPLARDAATVTPGIDDTPYLLHALDALTGSLTPSSSRANSGNSGNRSSGTCSYPFLHLSGETQDRHTSQPLSKDIHGAGIGPLPASLLLPSHPQPVCGWPDSGKDATSVSSSLSTLEHASPLPTPSSLPPHRPKTTQTYIDPDVFSSQPRCSLPRPDFKPAILRPTSLILFISLCLLLDAGFVSSAIYSRIYSGLTAHSGNAYGGQYFVFRILPQLVAVILFLHAHSISLAVIRIRPFALMATAIRPGNCNHNGPIFDSLYPHSLLWPPLLDSGTCHTWVPLLGFWLMNLAVPLQSAVFSVVIIDGKMRWATVQGVAWALVGLYSSVAATAFMLLAYSHNRLTGLLCDPRSIADLVVLASNSGALADYHGTELLGTRGQMYVALRQRGSDRLGYWTWDDGHGRRIWHGIGPGQAGSTWHEQKARGGRVGRVGGDGTPERNAVRRASGNDEELEDMALSPHSRSVRYRYLPWCMRSGQLLCLIGASFSLLLALFIVSFLPSTKIKTGFLPRVATTPTADAFSAANFLYSFLPALLGQIMFLLFASLELSLRVLQPWAELAKNARGALPEASILADYPACLPLQSTVHALLNRHWRVAALSLMSTLFAFLPVLGGGLFLASEAALGDGTVRMVPNMVLYDVILTLLVLYVACLVATLPRRNEFRLPHGVTSIAEILSFCANDDLAREPAFQSSERDALQTQLGMNSRPDARSRWIFATGTTGGDRRLGIHRVRRYTRLTNRPRSHRPLR